MWRRRRSFYGNLVCQPRALDDCYFIICWCCCRWIFLLDSIWYLPFNFTLINFNDKIVNGVSAYNTSVHCVMFDLFFIDGNINLKKSRKCFIYSFDGKACCRTSCEIILASIKVRQILKFDDRLG